MKILVTGSSGLVGSAMIPFLKSRQHQVFCLVRKKTNLQANEISWDIEKGRIDSHHLEGFDVVVHLAGENLMGWWTKAKKEKIRKSRVQGTQLLSQKLCQLRKPPHTLICASAIGYYGNQGKTVLTEQSAKGHGFLADVCQDWEKACQPALEKGIRVVNLRFGLVLSPKGGALKLMLPIFKWGMGGKLGSGKQYISWIDLEDLLRVIHFAIENKKLAGPVNVVTPYPVTNDQFTKALGQILHRPTLFSVPDGIIRLLLGELGTELLLTSQYVQPQILEKTDFEFYYPRIKDALQHLLSHRS